MEPARVRRPRHLTDRLVPAALLAGGLVLAAVAVPRLGGEHVAPPVALDGWPGFESELDPDAAPDAQAGLWVLPRTDSVAEPLLLRTTIAGGEFELPLGPRYATAGQHFVGALDPGPITVRVCTADGETVLASRTATLRPGGRHGLAFDLREESADRAPREVAVEAPAGVDALRWLPLDALFAARRSGEPDPTPRVAARGADGRFALAGVEPGEVVLRLDGGLERVVRVAPDDRSIALADLDPTAVVAVTVEVTDARDGAPVEAFELVYVTAGASEDPALFLAPERAAGADGLARLLVAPGELRLAVRAEGLAPATLRTVLVPGRPARVTTTLRPQR